MAKISKDDAIKIAENLVMQRKIDAQVGRILEPTEKFPNWQINFDLILPEGETHDPPFFTVEIDDSSGIAEII